jgi:hypothetical protein
VHCPKLSYPLFLDRHIGEMDKDIVHLWDAGVVLDSAEATETQFEQVALERPE